MLQHERESSGTAAMTEQNEQALIDAFKAMWGNYHEPTRLIHRSFRVVAGNATYLSTGGQVGGKCNATNPELHKGCRAIECLKTRKTTCKTSDMNGVRWDSYWVPVEGSEDYYVHFTNGMMEFIAKMSERKEQTK